MASFLLKLTSIHKELRKSLVAGQSSKLLIFCNAPNAIKQQLVLSLPIDCENGYQVELDRIPPGATHFCFWWYAKDFSPDEPTTAALVLQGVGFLPMRPIASAEVQLTSVGPLRDRTYPHMAHLAIRNVMVKGLENASPIPLPDSRQLDDYGSAVTQELFGRDIPQHAVNADGVMRWPDSNVYMAFPDHKRAIPAWIFTWSAWEDRLYKSVDTPATIRRYLECCKARLINNTDPEWTEAEHMELACEAATYLPLLLPYRKDRVLAEVTEQYTSVSHSPAPLQTGIDCEDATEATLRILYRMQQDPSCSQSVDPDLHGLLQEYEFMFCVVTLKLDTDIFYHAVAMGFDKKWLNDKLDSSLSWFPSRAAKLPKHPCVLLECTDFIGSHYGFNKERQQEDTRAYHMNPIARDSAWHTFVPPKLLRSTAQYRHLISAYSPQWIATRGIAELAFYFNNGLGVPLTELLSHHDDVLQNLQVRAPTVKATPLLPLAKRILEYAPLYKDLPRVDDSNPTPFQPLYKGSTSFTRDELSWEKWQTHLREENQPFVAAFELVHANVPLYYITLT